jgi:hypothetical protein
MFDFSVHCLAQISDLLKADHDEYHGERFSALQ